MNMPHLAETNRLLPRASLAICRLLIQDSLMAAVKVLNTAVKKVGRPDLPGRRKDNSLHTMGSIV